MFCNKCGSLIYSDDEFCMKCGNHIRSIETTDSMSTKEKNENTSYLPKKK